MAIPYEVGVSLTHPSRTNVIVRGDDHIELEQDVVGVSGSLPQHATVQETLGLINALVGAVQAALTPGQI